MKWPTGEEPFFENAALRAAPIRTSSILVFPGMHLASIASR